MARFFALPSLLLAVAAGSAPDGRGGGDPVPVEEREENAKRIPCPFLAGGCGSKLTRRGKPQVLVHVFHLPGFHFGTGSLSHSQDCTRRAS